MAHNFKCFIYLYLSGVKGLKLDIMIILKLILDMYLLTDIKYFGIILEELKI